MEGERIRLREFRADDLEDSLAVMGDDRVTRTMSFDSLTREEQQQRLHAAIERAQHIPRTEFYLAVAQRSDDRLVGVARLGLGGVQAARLGCAIAADYWKHGYAAAACRLLITYGFTELGLHRITGAVGPENTASHALVRSLGFTREGTLRDHVFTNGAWRDSVLYSILTHEWTPASRRSARR